MSEEEAKNEDYEDYEEIAVFTQNDCPNCKEMKEALKEYFESGDLIELNISEDSDAKLLAEKLKISEVPTFISIKGKKVCTLDITLKPVKCEELPEEVNLKKKKALPPTTS